MSDAKATQPVTATERTRVNFGKIPEVMELPNLISVQKESFDRFMTDGLREAFKESSPIQSQNHILEVTFGEHQFGDPAHTVEECREKDMTYQAPLLTDVRLTNKETGEIKEQLVFMGDFPMMTDQGTRSRRLAGVRGRQARPAGGLHRPQAQAVRYHVPARAGHRYHQRRDHRDAR